MYVKFYLVWWWVGGADLEMQSLNHQAISRWSKRHSRPLSGLEMMAAIGFPMTDEIAAAAAVPKCDASMLTSRAKDSYLFLQTSSCFPYPFLSYMHSCVAFHYFRYITWHCVSLHCMTHITCHYIWLCILYVYCLVLCCILVPLETSQHAFRPSSLETLWISLLLGLWCSRWCWLAWQCQPWKPHISASQAMLCLEPIEAWLFFKSHLWVPLNLSLQFFVFTTCRVQRAKAPARRVSRLVLSAGAKQYGVASPMHHSTLRSVCLVGGAKSSTGRSASAPNKHELLPTDEGVAGDDRAESNTWWKHSQTYCVYWLIKVLYATIWWSTWLAFSSDGCICAFSRWTWWR